jgi:hypothetical protein
MLLLLCSLSSPVSEPKSWSMATACSHKRAQCAWRRCPMAASSISDQFMENGSESPEKPKLKFQIESTAKLNWGEEWYVWQRNNNEDPLLAAGDEILCYLRWIEKQCHEFCWAGKRNGRRTGGEDRVGSFFPHQRRGSFQLDKLMVE